MRETLPKLFSGAVKVAAPLPDIERVGEPRTTAKPRRAGASKLDRLPSGIRGHIRMHMAKMSVAIDRKTGGHTFAGVASPSVHRAKRRARAAVQKASRRANR